MHFCHAPNIISKGPIRASIITARQKSISSSQNFGRKWSTTSDEIMRWRKLNLKANNCIVFWFFVCKRFFVFFDVLTQQERAFLIDWNGLLENFVSYWRFSMSISTYLLCSVWSLSYSFVTFPCRSWCQQQISMKWNYAAL